MKINRNVARSIEFAGIALLVCSGVASAAEPVQIAAAESSRPLIIETVKTNWSRTLLTNVIEIRLPKVVVLDQFYTNTIVSFTTNNIEVARTQWVDQFKTNITFTLRTNWMTRTLTNTIVMDRFQTNVTDLVITNAVTARVTNWVTRFLTNTLVIDQYRTNQIDRYSTNLLTHIRTNTMVVDAVQTNLLYAHRTNWTTLNVTNWEAVLIVKTNWVRQPVTTVVAVDLPASQQSSVASESSKPAGTESKAEIAAPLRTEDAKDFMFEWVRTGESQKEVVLALKSLNGSGTTLKIHEWRVERSDAAILVMGRQSQFRGDLPPGTYNVTVKARSSDNGPIVTLHGVIRVTADTDAHRALVATVAHL